MKKSDLKQLIREILAEQIGVAPNSFTQSSGPSTGGSSTGGGTKPPLPTAPVGGQTQATGGDISVDEITQLEQTFEAMLTSNESPDIKRRAQQSLNTISKNRRSPSRLKEILKKIWQDIIGGGPNPDGGYLEEKEVPLIYGWRNLPKWILGL